MEGNTSKGALFMSAAEFEVIYRFFKSQPGSYAIAKPHNLEAIIHFSRQKQPKRVLELGGGIGTLSYTILSFTDATIDIYETNVFCQNKLNENLKPGPAVFKFLMITEPCRFQKSMAWLLLMPGPRGYRNTG